MEETTSRRARLEQELGLLQQDVASLCSKLQRAPNFAAAEEAPNDVVATLPPSEPRRETNALGRVARLQRSLDDMTRRRDEALCEGARLRAEVERLKTRGDKYAQLKAAHAALRAGKG